MLHLTDFSEESNEPIVTSKSPRLSIGFPVRNGGIQAVAVVESVVQQTLQDFELIVSDNDSTDGTSEKLEAAASDARIIYVRQQPALRAYDNFRFVLDKARAEYFMWIAHDDTRDADFAARLVSALDETPEAVLAFGDLNIVTPSDPVGQMMSFPFDTDGLSRWERLHKLSKLQCFYFYGVWRTDVIRNVPYAYCSWWPDLPMLLAASIKGTFIHVSGTKFNYLEIPKSNVDRVKEQDYTIRFNLPLAVAQLTGATFRACSGIGGSLLGAYAASLVLLRQIQKVPGYLWRRIEARLR